MVILCTDGLANLGLGSFDDEDKEATQKFYEELANYANEIGVMISIITIKGEQCQIETIGKLAEITNGNVTRVEPKDIAKDFANILQDEIVAT